LRFADGIKEARKISSMDSARSFGAGGQYDTEVERSIDPAIAEIFNSSNDPVGTRLKTFPRYVRRAQLTRFLALYELFKLIVPMKGSIVECGVFRGFSLMTWAKLSAVLEPTNMNRRIYGFDTFTGFPTVHSADQPERAGTEEGEMASPSEDELRALIEIYDRDRYLGHIPKVELVPGDMSTTIPDFIERHPHLVIGLLYLDADLYESTAVALEYFVPRMHAGSILAFDELDHPRWPGETTALVEKLGLHRFVFRRFPFDPGLAFATLSDRSVRETSLDWS
jgi:hypothetical protein